MNYRIGSDLMEIADESSDPICEVCGSEMEWEDCDLCGGEGFSHHDCGDDCCCCRYPEANVTCAQCDGCGGWWYCANARQHATEAA